MKIKILNNIDKAGLSVLENGNFEFTSELNEAAGIVLRSHNLQSMEVPENLHAISRAGAGTNNINVELCSERGVVVFNTPGANANAVKEIVICALILSKRDLVSGNKNLDSIDIEKMEDEQINIKIEGMKKEFVGQEIRGKQLSVIGLGAIGSLVANQAISMGMNVKAFDPGLTVDIALGLPSSLDRCSTIEEALASSDYVSIHIPLNDATKGIIDEEKFNEMKDDAVLLNFSRGGIVNEEDLIDALNQNKIYKYVTDFPTKKLLERISQHKDVMIFPHLGASTKESEVNCAVMACSQISDFLQFGKINNSVNFPNISSEKVAKHRIFITNRNQPGIISLITESLAEAGVNISEFVNKSRGEIACNIIDSDDEIKPENVSKLENIEGVTSARLCY